MPPAPQTAPHGQAAAEEFQTPTVIIDFELCKGCGLCIAWCPKKVLRSSGRVNRLGYVATEYAGEGCIGCGTCFYVCPEPGAVSVIRPDR